MQFGVFSRNGAILFSLLLVAVAMFLYVSSRSPQGQERLRHLADALLFRGALGNSVSRERFSSAVALSLASGLSFDDALDKASLLVDEPKMVERITRCRQFLQEGITFSSAVEKAGIFGGLEIGLISAGFKAGESEAVMAELSRRCHNKTEDILSRIMSRIEPVLIVFLVVVVGMLLLSVMLPLLAMMNAIGS
jgi:type IV pilus assembly protein PilC